MAVWGDVRWSEAAFGAALGRVGALLAGLGRTWGALGLSDCALGLSLVALGRQQLKFSCRFAFIFRSSVALVFSCYCCCHLLVGTAGCSVFGLFIGVVFACLG